MAIQPEDRTTADIFEHPSVTEQKRVAQAAEELHLAAEHKLVKVQAFIRNEKKADKKTAGAERVEKHREKLKAAGLVSFAIPREVAEAAKNTEGGFVSWLDAQKSMPVERVVERIVEVEKIVEVSVNVERIVEVEKIIIEKVQLSLSQTDLNLIAIGKSVESLTGIRRFLIKKLIGY